MVADHEDEPVDRLGQRSKGGARLVEDLDGEAAALVEHIAVAEDIPDALTAAVPGQVRNARPRVREPTVGAVRPDATVGADVLAMDVRKEQQGLRHPTMRSLTGIRMNRWRSLRERTTRRRDAPVVALCCGTLVPLNRA